MWEAITTSDRSGLIILNGKVMLGSLLPQRLPFLTEHDDHDIISLRHDNSTYHCVIRTRRCLSIMKLTFWPRKTKAFYLKVTEHWSTTNDVVGRNETIGYIVTLLDVCLQLSQIDTKRDKCDTFKTN